MQTRNASASMAFPTSDSRQHVHSHSFNIIPRTRINECLPIRVYPFAVDILLRSIINGTPLCLIIFSKSIYFIIIPNNIVDGTSGDRRNDWFCSACEWKLNLKGVLLIYPCRIFALSMTVATKVIILKYNVQMYTGYRY